MANGMNLQILTSLRWFNPIVRTETEGQGLVEYALIILFMAIACLVALTSMGDAILELWAQVRNSLIPAMGG